MKKAFSFLLGILFTITLNAQLTTANSSPANDVKVAEVKPVTSSEDLLILMETEYDFGKIPQGKPVIHIFFGSACLLAIRYLIIVL